MDNPDFLVIGGGSAGAVVAARLSEDPATRVLLVEAGHDTPPDALPADIADTFPTSSLNPDYFWPGLQAVRSSGGPTRPFPQARIMGGGSSVMGLWALRGVPSDFEAWTAAGAEGWGWTDILPYYRKLENDFDRDQSQTSRGTYSIRRLPRREWPGFVSAIEQAAVERGLPLVEDINEKHGEGFFPMPLSQDMTTRASSAHAYLTEAVRRRPNLRIMANACVTALQFDGLRAKGASVDHAGKTVEIAAREIVLCAGAIHSPTILLRAGIGPADELQKIGIVPRLDRRRRWTQSAKPSLSAFRAHVATAIAPAKHSAKVCDRRRTGILETARSPTGGLVAVHDRPCQPTQLRSGCCDGRVRALRTILAR